MRYLCFIGSIGALLLAALFFYIGAPLFGAVLLPGIIILATAPTYKVETTIDKSKCILTYTSTLLRVSTQKEVPLSEVSMLAKVSGHTHGKYSTLYFVTNDRKMKIIEFNDPDIDAVNSPVLDSYVRTIRNFCEFNYEETF